MNYFNRKANLYAKIIAWLQIAGGILGLFVMASLMLKLESINGALLLIILFGVGLYIFSIYCGVRLFRQHTRRYGIIVSLVNQGLQFLQFCIAGYGLSYTSGIDITVGIKDHEFNFGFHVSSSFFMEIKTDEPLKFCINFVAIAVFVILLQIYRKPQEEYANFDERDYTDPEISE